MIHDTQDRPSGASLREERSHPSAPALKQDKEVVAPTGETSGRRRHVALQANGPGILLARATWWQG